MFYSTFVNNITVYGILSTRALDYGKLAGYAFMRFAFFFSWVHTTSEQSLPLRDVWGRVRRWRERSISEVVVVVVVVVSS